MSWKKLTISRQLLLCSGLVGALFGGLLAVMSNTIHSMAAVDAQVQQVATVRHLCDEILTSVVAQQNAVRAFIITQKPAFLADYNAAAEQYEALFKQYRATETNAADLAAMDAIYKRLGAWRTDSLARQIEWSRDPSTREDVVPLVSGAITVKARQDIGAILAAQDSRLDAGRAMLTNHIRLTHRLLLAGAALAVAVAGFGAWLGSCLVGRPLARLCGALQRLTAGNYSVDVPLLHRGDEVGQVASAIAALRDAARAASEKEQAATAARQLAEAERGRADTDRAAQQEAQAAVVADIGRALSCLAKGDLTARLPDAFPAGYETLRANFNSAVEQLHGALAALVSNTQTIRSAAGELTTAADDLARRTEQQAASLEQTAASLDQITATVRKTADGAAQANTVASTARLDAEHSGQVVRKAVAAMGAIEGSAKQISSIISVIDEIAFQTNLLALNAGVEAARAGEAGRGFAVVASEVRALAQRSADAAREIKGLISTSATQVGQGVELVGETGRALDRIVTSVVQISDVVAGIAASAQEQAAGLQQVNTAINQMDQVTQQNAAMVEQSTAASHGLAKEASALAGLASRFHVHEETPKPAAAPPVRRAAATAAAIADGWEEF